METESLLLTILQNHKLSRNTIVVTRNNVTISINTLLLKQTLLHYVDSQILSQVNTCSILGTQFERSTTRIIDSLLRRIPYVNAGSLIIPTFLVTFLVARTISVARHVRLEVLRSLVPNQTFQLNAGWNDQSIVRSNGGLVTISLINLQSNGIVLIYAIIPLITSKAIPALISITTIAILGIAISLIILICSKVAVRVDGLIRWPRSEVDRSLNLNTSLEDTLAAGGKVYGTFLDGENLYARPLETGETVPAVVIIGNESNGISPAVAELVSDRLLIPPFPGGTPTSESLNAAVATAVTVAEFRRRIWARR